MTETLVALIQAQIQQDLDDAFLRIILGSMPPTPIPEIQSV